MRGFAVAFSCEAMKLRRSRILWLSVMAFSFIPFVGGFFMFVLKDPEFARKTGLLGAKAQLMGSADWPSFFEFLSQAVSIGGLLLFGFITSWMFGMEYSDRTLKDLLALPISRIRIVLAKFALIFLWCFCLSLLVFLLGTAVGKIVVLPGWNAEVLKKGLNMFFMCSILTIVLCTPVAFFACFGRGYLSPLGFVVLMLVAAQIIAVAGYGQYFPWAVPALLSRAAGEGGSSIIPFSFVSVVFASLAGLLATSLWWQYADHT